MKAIIALAIITLLMMNASVVPLCSGKIPRKKPRRMITDDQSFFIHLRVAILIRNKWGHRAIILKMHLYLYCVLHLHWLQVDLRSVDLTSRRSKPVLEISRCLILIVHEMSFLVHTSNKSFRLSMVPLENNMHSSELCIRVDASMSYVNVDIH